MLLLVCYILCNFNYNLLKSSINLLTKLKKKKILEVYSCSFPGCFKPESYCCPPEKLLIPVLVQTQAFTKWRPGELTWDRQRSALSQIFARALGATVILRTQASTVQSPLGHSDRQSLRYSCSVSVWFSSEGAFSAHTPEHDFLSQAQGILSFFLEVCSFPYLIYSFFQEADPPPLITKPIFLPKSAYRNFLMTLEPQRTGSKGPLIGMPPQCIKDSEPAAILATVQSLWYQL